MQSTHVPFSPPPRLFIFIFCTVPIPPTNTVSTRVNIKGLGLLVTLLDSQDQHSHPSHNTTTLAYRQQRPSAVTSASNSPDSASGSVSASGSKTDSRYSSRPSSHNQNRPVTHSTEEAPPEDCTGYENAASYTMNPHAGYEPNQAHQYNYPPGQNFQAAAHTGGRGSRGAAGSRDGYYAMDHGAVAGFDPTTMTPIMHPGSTVFNAHYGSPAYGTAAAMDTNINGVMQQHSQQHQQAEYNGEYVGDMAAYGEYQEETEVTPRTGRPSRAKKGKPVHNCLSCGRVSAYDTPQSHVTKSQTSFKLTVHRSSQGPSTYGKLKSPPLFLAGIVAERSVSNIRSRHQLSHEPFKYFCSYPGCNKSFSRPDLLSRHQQKQ